MPEHWTLRALKEHYDVRFEAMQEAVKVADAANEKRLDSVNEFRASLSDQQATFVTKETCAALEKRIDNLETTQRDHGMKAVGSGQLGSKLLAGLGAVGTVFGIIAVILVFNQ